MKVAVLSDIHDRLDHLASVLAAVERAGAGRILFLGDFCAPFSLAAMAEGFSGPVDAVFGNNDGDVFLLCQVASGHPRVTLHGHLAELDIEGCRVGCHHYPEIGRRLAESGAYGAVFSGHDHQRYAHDVSGVLWANPGEVMGRFGVVSFGLFEPGSGAFEHVEVSVR